jgi:hypothetical protein
MNEGFPLKRKETFSVSMVIFIGFFYLLSLASALFQTKSIPVQRIFGLTEIKFLLLGIFYWMGAVAFFRLKTIGWIICTATLLNFVVVLFKFVITVSRGARFDTFSAIIVSCFILMLMSFLFLFNKETRIKFMVNNKSYLITICVYALLLVMTFVL